jgi:hypothetical protein
MDRRGRVNHDRAEMARKALRKAGYLSREEAEKQAKAAESAAREAKLNGEEEKAIRARFEEAAAGFIADLLHIADSLGIKNIAKPENVKVDTTTIQARLISEATKAYFDDARSSPFGES